MTLKACVLIRTEAGKHGVVARTVAKIEGVVFAFPSLGRTDVVVNVEAPSLKELTKRIIRIASTQGVNTTETLIGLEM